VIRDKQVHIADESETTGRIALGPKRASRSAAVKWLVVMWGSPYWQVRRSFQLQTNMSKQDYAWS